MFKCANGHISAPYEAEKKMPIAVRPVETTILSNHRFNKRTGEVKRDERVVSRTEIVREASFCPTHADGAPAPEMISEQARIEEIIHDPEAATKAEASHSAWLEREATRERRDDNRRQNKPADEEWEDLEDLSFAE